MSILKVRKSMTVFGGFQVIFADCVMQIQDNAPAVVDSQDPEAVHQMRVGVRRLKSALSLFKRVLPFPGVLCDELDWLWEKLAQARDWEVLSGSSLADLDSGDGQAVDTQALQRAVARIARKKRQQAATAVRSVRYRRLMGALSGWLKAAASSGGNSELENSTLNLPLKRFAKDALKDQRGRLKRRGKKLIRANPQTRHRLRVAAKKVRYANEFFRSLYSSRQMKVYINALSALQDELGWLNDMSVAQKLLAELAGQRPELAEAIDFANGDFRSRTGHRSHRIKKLWRRFERTEPPTWK
jgi:CHAD domain-containing protein